MALVSTGVIDIGRKSACCLGAATFGIGRMLACFHCCGAVDDAIERLKSIAICLEKTGAPSRRNQADSPSRPVAVERRLSSILKIFHSETCSDCIGVVSCLRRGVT